jgi:hypothetical protein
VVTFCNFIRNRIVSTTDISPVTGNLDLNYVDQTSLPGVLQLWDWLDSSKLGCYCSNRTTLCSASQHTEGPSGILQRAFMSTMKDPEFLAEADKAKLDINPLDGATLESNVKEVFNLDPVLVVRLKEILKIDCRFDFCLYRFRALRSLNGGRARF